MADALVPASAAALAVAMDFSGTDTAHVPAVNVPAPDLDQLHARLVEVSTALAARAGEQTRKLDQLHAVLAEVRERVQSLLDALPTGDSDRQQHVTELASIARQAAEHPRHLDYLTSLGDHAGEIADMLDALQSHASLHAQRAELQSLLDRLTGTLG